MARKLPETLKKIVGDATGVLEVIGLGGVALYSIDIQEVKNWDFEGLRNLFEKFRSDNFLLDTASEKITVLLLTATTLVWYYRYKSAVLNEIDIVNEAFSDEKLPVSLSKLSGNKYLKPLSYFIVAAFIALLLAVNNIKLFSAFCLILHFCDLFGSGFTLQGINKTFATYRVSQTSATAEFTERRRQAVIDYYFENPTLLRICCSIGISVSALILSETFDNEEGFLKYVPYYMIFSNIVVSELIMSKWRRERDQCLENIDAAEQEKRESDQR